MQCNQICTVLKKKLDSYLWIFVVSLQADTTAEYERFIHLDDVVCNDNAFTTSRWPAQAGLHLGQPFTNWQIIVQRRRGQTGAQTWRPREQVKGDAAG